MFIRILGAGFYGLHIGLALDRAGHIVEIHESQGQIMGGASGNIPARLHQGFHYPRSYSTRAACRAHQAEFMAQYGKFTRGVPVNVYAIAADQSLVDYQQYVDTLRGEVDFVEVHDPAELGLQNIEGAVLTGERHIVTDQVRAHFAKEAGGLIALNSQHEDDDGDEFDLTIDCTFSANSAAGVDRYEPCLVLLLKGPCDRAITVMDGPFASLYPWDEAKELSSLSSALWTPFSKTCRTYAEANAVLDNLTQDQVEARGRSMFEAMAHHYPAIADYLIYEYRTSVRAMPASGADSRLVDIRREGDIITVRAGKIDAIIAAERAIKAMIE